LMPNMRQWNALSVVLSGQSKSWQIVGKLLFREIFPERGKVRIAAYLLVI
jgi:hypothetical protein